MLYGNTLHMQVIIFRDADKAFLRHIAVILKPCIYLAGEFIVHKRDRDAGVFFLCQGDVEILGDRHRTELHRGSPFGIKPMLYNLTADSALRAITHADLLTFSKEDLQEVINLHPDSGTKIRLIALQEYGLPVQM